MFTEDLHGKDTILHFMIPSIYPSIGHLIVLIVAYDCDDRVIERCAKTFDAMKNRNPDF